MRRCTTDMQLPRWNGAERKGLWLQVELMGFQTTLPQSMPAIMAQAYLDCPHKRSMPKVAPPINFPQTTDTRHCTISDESVCGLPGRS